VVKQLADALAASGTTATVVLIFADGPQPSTFLECI
jgi:hypothetical protein